MWQIVQAAHIVTFHDASRHACEKRHIQTAEAASLPAKCCHVEAIWGRPCVTSLPSQHHHCSQAGNIDMAKRHRCFPKGSLGTFHTPVHHHGQAMPRPRPPKARGRLQLP